MNTVGNLAANDLDQFGLRAGPLDLVLLVHHCTIGKMLLKGSAPFWGAGQGYPIAAFDVSGEICVVLR